MPTNAHILKMVLCDLLWEQRETKTLMQGMSTEGRQFVKEVPYGTLYHEQIRVIEGDSDVEAVGVELAKTELRVRIL